VPHFAKLVRNEDIAVQEYKLSASTYVEQEDKREIVDIKKLNAEIEGIVERQSKLRAEIAAIIAEIEGAEA
jgi:type I restriction enzyme M protein